MELALEGHRRKRHTSSWLEKRVGPALGRRGRAHLSAAQFHPNEAASGALWWWGTHGAGHSLRKDGGRGSHPPMCGYLCVGGV